MDPQNEMVVSYLTLRQMIGWIGLLMPFGVRIVAFVVEGVSRDSISDYYYTAMHDSFVVTLILIGTLLTCYRSPALRDTVVSIMAGIAAIGIAFFPTKSGTVWSCNLVHGPSQFHVPFVAAFFVLTIYMILFRFVAFTPENPTHAKIIRNRIYRVCGAVMAIATAIIVVELLLHRPIFWPETVAVVSFAVAWLVKGQTLVLKDPKDASAA